MNKRAGWVAVAALAAAGAAGLWLARPESASKAREGDLRAPPAEPAEAPRVSPLDSPAEEPVARASATVEESEDDLLKLSLREQAERLGDTDSSDGIDLPPPPLPSGPPVTVPPPDPPDPEAVLRARAEDLEVLDEALARLERRAADQERAGDESGAERSRIRLRRLREVRERRAQELDDLRSGDDQDPPDGTAEAP